MSAFIVGDECINRVLDLLERTDCDRPWIVRELAKATEIERTDPDFWPKIGAAMFALNVEAVEARYLGKLSNFRDLNYRHQAQHSSPLAALKSLTCWLYQCNEEPTDQRPLYKTMREIEGRLALDLVQATPEWEACRWG